MFFKIVKMNRWKFSYKIENNFTNEFFVTAYDSFHIWGLVRKKMNLTIMSCAYFQWLDPLYSLFMLKINLKRCLSLLKTFLLSFSLNSSRWGCSSQFWIIVSSAIVRKYGTVCNVQSLSSAIIRRVILVSFPVFKLLATIFWFFLSNFSKIFRNFSLDINILEE